VNLDTKDPGLDAALLDMERARKQRDAVEKLVTNNETLVDELITVAMDLGALKAPDGILRLTDRLAELRRNVLARVT
jgi:hypothetical protein